MEKATFYNDKHVVWDLSHLTSTVKNKTKALPGGTSLNFKIGIQDKKDKSRRTFSPLTIEKAETSQLW